MYVQMLENGRSKEWDGDGNGDGNSEAITNTIRGPKRMTGVRCGRRKSW
jgi:hypothetical protein